MAGWGFVIVFKPQLVPLNCPASAFAPFPTLLIKIPPPNFGTFGELDGGQGKEGCWERSVNTAWRWVLNGHGCLLVAVQSLAPNPGSATNRRDRVWICSLQSGAQSPPFSGGKSLAEAGGTIDKGRSRAEWSELVMDAESPQKSSADFSPSPFVLRAGAGRDS